MISDALTVKAYCQSLDLLGRESSFRRDVETSTPGGVRSPERHRTSTSIGSRVNASRTRLKAGQDGGHR